MLSVRGFIGGEVFIMGSGVCLKYTGGDDNRHESACEEGWEAIFRYHPNYNLTLYYIVLIMRLLQPIEYQFISINTNKPCYPQNHYS